MAISSCLIRSCQLSSVGVSFSPTSGMCLVDKHDNKGDLFYSAQELHIIKLRSIHDSNNLIASNINGKHPVHIMLENIDNTSACLGIECCLSKLTYIQRIQNRKAIVEAVLREQHRQLRLGIDDPIIIAKISLAESAWARERARTIALLHSDSVVKTRIACVFKYGSLSM